MDRPGLLLDGAFASGMGSSLLGFGCGCQGVFLKSLTRFYLRPDHICSIYAQGMNWPAFNHKSRSGGSHPFWDCPDGLPAAPAGEGERMRGLGREPYFMYPF
jgi:hypothetical protein